MPASSDFHSPMTDPVMRLQLHCIPSSQSGYPAESTITCRDFLQIGDWPRYLDELVFISFSLSILLVVLLLVHFALILLSGALPPFQRFPHEPLWLTPGLDPPFVHSQAHLRYETQVRVGVQSR